MKNIEQQLEDEKRRSQAIIDLLNEALVKIGLDPNSYTVAGKIDMLVKYAQQGVQVDGANALPVGCCEHGFDIYCPACVANSPRS